MLAVQAGPLGQWHRQSRTGRDGCPSRYAVGASPKADAGGIHCCVEPSAATLAISSFSPGPIVVETLTRLTKAPLTPAGRARLTAPTNALMFSTSACSVKLALPTPA